MKALDVVELVKELSFTRRKVATSMRLNRVQWTKQNWTWGEDAKQQALLDILMENKPV